MTSPSQPDEADEAGDAVHAPDGGDARGGDGDDRRIEVELADADNDADNDASDDEVAAIVAAVEVVWPRPPAAVPVDRAPRWRFSGRWWSKPVPLRRSRPW
jgi:hypothetical protein